MSLHKMLDWEIDVHQLLHENGFEIKSRINEGGFSVVYNVYSIQYQTNFAAKVMRKDERNHLIAAQNELQALSTLHHSNIIKLYKFFESNKFIAFILELCENGTLADQYQNGTMGVSAFLNFARPIVDALCLCHENQIAHCDIKPENILFDGKFTPKLCDFGICQLGDARKTSIGGTIAYMAPEFLQPNQNPDFKKRDVWSLGLLFYYALSGHFPWTPSCNQKLNQQTLNLIETLNGMDIPHSFRNLINQMLSHTPSMRPAMQEIRECLNSQLIQENQKEILCSSSSFQNALSLKSSNLFIASTQKRSLARSVSHTRLTSFSMKKKQG
jgi:serine/threonine protein kinase